MPHILDHRFQMLDVRKQSNLQSKIYNLKSTNGFTLIEVLLSMFFLIAMVTILLSASGTLLHTRTSNLQTTATKIATRKIENLRNTAFASLPIGTNSFADSDLSQLPQGTATSTITDYSILPDPPDPDIKNVLITISYTENSAPREVKLETLIYKNGL